MTKTIRLMEKACAGTSTRWLILPSDNLRSLVLRQLLKKFPDLNYVCRWKDVNGYGLHVTHAEWVWRDCGPNAVYEVPN